MKNKIYLPLYIYILVLLISFCLFYKSYINEVLISLILIIVIVVEIIIMNYEGIKKIFKKIFKK